MVAADSHSQNEEKPKAAASVETTPELPTVNVLVIHHDATMRHTLTQSLRCGGYAVFAVSDWQAALEQLQKRVIDVAILDMMVSQQEHSNLLEELLTLYPATRVVMICNHCSLDEAVDVMKQGAVDFIQEPHGYLQRPLGTERIQAVVAEALRRTPAVTLPSMDYTELVKLAWQWAQKRNFSNARQLLGHAIRLVPTRPEALNLLGAIIEYQGDRLEALRLYRASIDLDPTYEPAQRNLDRATSNPKSFPQFA